MSFEQCALYCAGNMELVKGFNRLSGCHLGERRTPIDIAIDGACGYDPDREGDTTVSGLCLPLHLAPSIEISRRSTCFPGAASFSKLIDGAIFLQAGHHWKWASELTF